MTILVFSGLLLVLSFFAGILGSITGLGGGAVLIPALVLLFHINIYYAMGASMIAVIATSSGATSVYLRHGFTNLRIGMLLEVGAVSGAILGALLVKYIPTSILAILLGSVLLISAYFVLKRHEDQDQALSSHPWAQALKLNGEFPVPGGSKAYQVQNVPPALSHPPSVPEDRDRPQCDIAHQSDLRHIRSVEERFCNDRELAPA